MGNTVPWELYSFLSITWFRILIKNYLRVTTLGERVSNYRTGKWTPCCREHCETHQLPILCAPRQGTSLKLLDAVKVGGRVRAASHVQGPSENITHGWDISSASQASRDSETNIWSSQPRCWAVPLGKVTLWLILPDKGRRPSSITAWVVRWLSGIPVPLSSAGSTSHNLALQF